MSNVLSRQMHLQNKKGVEQQSALWQLPDVAERHKVTSSTETFVPLSQQTLNILVRFQVHTVKSTKIAVLDVA
jgi:hypothetical protein